MVILNEHLAVDDTMYNNELYNKKLNSYINEF